MKKTRIIKTNGEMKSINPANGKHFDLQELYTLLNCDLIQIINLNEKIIMIIDEEGKLNADNELNMIATIYAVKAQAIYPNDCIVGTALICETNQLK